MSSLHRGDSKKFIIDLRNLANVRQSLSGAAIVLKAYDLPETEPPLFTKSLGSGITLALDALSAEGLIEAGDLANPGQYIVKAVISWVDDHLQFTASDLVTVA